MRNPLTFQVESYMGAAFVAALCCFLVAMFFISVKNFTSDLDIMNATTPQLKRGATTQQELVDNWLAENGITLPEGTTYQEILHLFPTKPWLTN